MKLLRWVPILIWVLVICWLSFSPLNKLSVKPPIGADKIAHVVMYAILGVLLARATSLGRNRSLFYILALLFAGGTEVVQHLFIPNRTGDWFDFIANCIGLLPVLYFWKRFEKT
jgi:VanZ family protein